MSKNEGKKLNAWAQFLNAIGNLTTKITGVILLIVILSIIGKCILNKNDGKVKVGDNGTNVSEKEINPTINWDEVDKNVRNVIVEAKAEADSFARKKVALWTNDIVQRIDDNFLDWYFSYWQQQLFGFKAIGYWFENLTVIEKFFGEKPTVSERITQEIQEEFAKRVLRPEIAQMQIETIIDSTVIIFVNSIAPKLDSVRLKYSIEKTDWEDYLNGIALMTHNVKADRQIEVGQKAITLAVVVSGTAATVNITSAIKPLIKNVGTKFTTKAATKGAGKIATSTATKTGTKVGAKFGGKLAGWIIAIGIVVWDVWDYHHTKKIEKPILRQNLLDYMEEIKHNLLYESDTGIMSIISRMEENVFESINNNPSKAK
jgi:hypothetical protein